MTPETCNSPDSISSKPGSNGDQAVNVAELSAWLHEEAHRAATFATRYQAASRFRAHWMDRSRKLSEAASALTASASEPEPVALKRTYYAEGKDCPFYEALSDKEFAWEATKMAQDLADMDTRELEEILPFVGVLSLAADRIERLANPVPTPDEAVEALKGARGAIEAAKYAASNGLPTRDPGAKTIYELTDVALSYLVTLSAAHPADGWRPRASVQPMKLSSGETDYYVAIDCGGRQMTVFCHKILGRAEYGVAELNWLFNGGKKPDILAFDTEPAAPLSAKPEGE